MAAVCRHAALHRRRPDGKRPLNHGDYDGWRSIAGQRLSNDGKFLVYGLFPQEGDGEVVIRNLVTGKEQREPGGARPAPAPATEPKKGRRVGTRRRPSHSPPTASTVVFSTSLPRRRSTRPGRKRSRRRPKDGMVIVDLASGKATRIERVKRFADAGEGVGAARVPEGGPDGSAQCGAGCSRNPGGDRSRSAGWRARRTGRRSERRGRPRRARPEFGSDLVVRNLADAAERTITDVVEFSLAEDGKQLVYAVARARFRQERRLRRCKPGAADAPAALLAGKGKYASLTWDENQTQIAFLSDRDDAAAKQPKWKLYRWDRQARGRQRAGRRRHARFPQGIRHQRQRQPELLQGRDARLLRVRAAPAPKEDDLDASRRRHKAVGGSLELIKTITSTHPEGARRTRPQPHLHGRLPDSGKEGGAAGG